MKTLCLSLLAAFTAVAVLPAPAVAGSLPAVVYNQDDDHENNGNGPNSNNAEQGSEEVSTDGPGTDCAEGYEEVNGLCAPEDGD